MENRTSKIICAAQTLLAGLKEEYTIWAGMEEDVDGKIRGKYDQNNHIKLLMN